MHSRTGGKEGHEIVAGEGISGITWMFVVWYDRLHVRVGTSPSVPLSTGFLRSEGSAQVRVAVRDVLGRRWHEDPPQHGADWSG